MKIQYIVIFLFAIGISACSELKDPKSVFLSEFKGTWKTTSDSINWFRRNFISTVNIPQGTIVNVASDGSFSINGTDFVFVELEGTGMLAIYRFTFNTQVKFVGIGFSDLDKPVITESSILQEELIIPIKPTPFLE